MGCTVVSSGFVREGAETRVTRVCVAACRLFAAAVGTQVSGDGETCVLRVSAGRRSEISERVEEMQGRKGMRVCLLWRDERKGR